MVLVETNVFVASLTDEPARGGSATEPLNQDRDFCTSILDLVDLRSVMTEPKRVEQDRVEDVLSDVYAHVDSYAPEISDQISAYNPQQDGLPYTLDRVLLALTDDRDATLAPFDGELLDDGAVEPSDLAAERSGFWLHENSSTGESCPERPSG
ncbi:VapC toxin family PIN domain ribonuclease [Halobacterium yunchengense]|uniref:VapC toxin family PIN domain ribonuclease n=1 Tax=Halobacterium yunchengense TaxID=3108497 RepID=UPI00300B81DD